MSRLGKVDKKFHTQPDLLAVKAGVKKWRAICDGTYDGDIIDCALWQHLVDIQRQIERGLACE